MNKKKTILTIICTLLIGFIIGFFISGRLANRRMEHRRAMMTKPGAEQHMLTKRLELSGEQITQISPILDTMISDQIELRQSHRTEMESARKDMFEKIKPYLKEEQLQRLEEMRQRMRPPHR